MRSIVLTVAVIAVSFLSASASAQLLGTSVTGSLKFSDGTVNYFDPANGLVPVGPLNNTQGPTVTIGSPAVEFGFLEFDFDDVGPVTIAADFDGTTLKLTESVQRSTTLLVQHYSFTDAAFAGKSITENSDTFINGGVSYSLVGSTLAVDWPAGRVNFGDSFAANFTLVPEPSTPSLIAVAALALSTRRRRMWNRLTSP